MKILSVIAKLFHADGKPGGRPDGQTDMTKPIGAFCNSVNGPKKPFFEKKK